MLGELAEHSAGCGTDRDRGKKRRGEEPDHQPHPTAERCALAAEVVTGLHYMHLAVGVLLH